MIVQSIHRDLKLSIIIFNIFLEARITDFGIAKGLSNNRSGPSTLIVLTTSGYLTLSTQPKSMMAFSTL
uniref:Protein kinase domain-containing protein n=1 Tax=Physcomitrium patens TaxID=3218 RepID=A0A2K1K829_PHYPA|nr:hypothetical protein PHYPA_011826 [Physcomitrium patens]